MKLQQALFDVRTTYTTTNCNDAVKEVALRLGYRQFAHPDKPEYAVTNADGIFDMLASGGGAQPGWNIEEIDSEQSVQFANAGQLVICAARSTDIHKANGHVFVIEPQSSAISPIDEGRFDWHTTQIWGAQSGTHLIGEGRASLEFNPDAQKMAKFFAIMPN